MGEKNFIRLVWKCESGDLTTEFAERRNEFVERVADKLKGSSAPGHCTVATRLGVAKIQLIFAGGMSVGNVAYTI